MDIKETIEMAVEIVGSQRELARLTGMPDQHISGFKKGRPCSAEKHARIADAAGLTTRARLILLEHVLEASRQSMPADDALREKLEAIVKALPEETPKIAPARGAATTKSPRLRKSLRT